MPKFIYEIYPWVEFFLENEISETTYYFSIKKIHKRIMLKLINNMKCQKLLVEFYIFIFHIFCLVWETVLLWHYKTRKRGFKDC